ncbi:MAG: hypothetical protein M1321_01255, partial [Candidatus Marsarchaeota archaeon]|nr:hypothetical protein [Candidatus Marsarchaeota archaeon]
AVKPSLTTQNYVKSYGVVMLQGKVACSTASPLQIYWFIDPYSPGSVRSLETMEGIQSRFPAGVQTRLEVLYTPYSQQIALSHGIGNTQAFGKYLFCASQQQNFSRFVNSVNSSYDGLYMSPQFLSTLANDSGLNRIALDSCIANSSVVIARQSVLAAYYNVTSTPMIVTNCQYQSIPQAEQYAMCAANSTFCRQ